MSSLVEKWRRGRTRGRRERYHRKYWAVTTLLKVTNTRAWQNITRGTLWGEGNFTDSRKSRRA